MSKIQKRVLAVFTLALVLLGSCVVRVMAYSVYNASLAQTAASQQTLTLRFAAGRGGLYDRCFRPLAGNKTAYIAAVTPGQAAAAALRRVLPAQKMREVYGLMQGGMPFLTELDTPVQAPGVLCFPQQERCTGSTLAPHMVGYLDSSGCGVSGAEKAFDSVLSGGGSVTKVTYAVDAMRHLLPGSSPQVTQSAHSRDCSVVLTLDRDIQKIAQDSAKALLKKGAVVVLQAGSGSVLASVSLPDFDPADVSGALQRPGSPLLNRVLQPYSVGSVFKLVAAAAALRHGADPNETYTCTGSETVDGLAFHCAGGEQHGKVNLHDALVRSCNCYFIKRMQTVPPAEFLQTARQLGFGQSMLLAPNFYSAAGTLPTADELKSHRALANFSFGQGSLTATPLQVAAMVNAVASGGMYTPPTLYAGRADCAGHATEAAVQPSPTAVLPKKDAALLSAAMRDCVTVGTGRPGQPSHVAAAAKTATAQTGRCTNGKENLTNWYAGFFPANAPRYVVVVLSEEGTGGGAACGPVFRRIADALYPGD